MWFFLINIWIESSNLQSNFFSIQIILKFWQIKTTKLLKFIEFTQERKFQNFPNFFVEN